MHTEKVRIDGARVFQLIEEVDAWNIKRITKIERVPKPQHALSMGNIVATRRQTEFNIGDRRRSDLDGICNQITGHISPIEPIELV